MTGSRAKDLSSSERGLSGAGGSRFFTNASYASLVQGHATKLGRAGTPADFRAEISATLS
jgi:hypothetical protein